MSARLVVVHDVLGTCFDLTKPIEELKSIFSNQIKDDRFAELIIMDWYHAGQRDFTNLSINGNYKPISACFKAGLPRVLLQAGLTKPKSDKGGATEDSQTQMTKRGGGAGSPSDQHFSQTKSDGSGSPFGEEIIERIMSTLSSLRPRPGMVNAFTKTYRDQTKLSNTNIKRVDLFGATNGGIALAQKLFVGALGESMPLYTGLNTVKEQENSVSTSEHKFGNGVGIFSCDENQIAKPDPRVYEEIKNRIQIKPDEDVRLWFVASHTWDLFAAKKQGFKTAWVTYEEFEMCSDIYGTPDVVAKDLDDIANKILQYESNKASQ